MGQDLFLDLARIDVGAAGDIQVRGAPGDEEEALIVEMAEVTPPVGFNLFVLQNMSGKDSNQVALAALPFFFLLVVAVAIITVFPETVMWLPKLVFPG